MIEQIRAELSARSEELGLFANALTIEPILNWGGFVNQSFRVTDGRLRLFVKIASDAEGTAGLETWRSVSALLEERYAAPRLLGWIEVPGTSRAGPVLEWVDGRTPAELDELPIRSVVAAVERLHADAEVRRLLLRKGNIIRSCAEAYVRAYHERFVVDLETIAAEPPPFVAPELIAWMQRETEWLERRIRSLEAFRMPADAPVHGDLWLNNVLVAPDGRWYLCDWDGLCLGDPVIDWAMLFGPSRQRVCPPSLQVVDTHVSIREAERERLQVYARASLLDWIIDPLSDWVEAGNHPEHGVAIRAANERVHGQALRCYQERYS